MIDPPNQIIMLTSNDNPNMGVAFSHFLGQLGVPSLCEGNSSFLERFLCGKASQEGLDGSPLCIFWTILWERNRLAFEDVNISVNRMKYTFLCNLWSWVNLYSVGRPRSLVDFFTWVGCK